MAAWATSAEIVKRTVFRAQVRRRSSCAHPVEEQGGVYRGLALKIKLDLQVLLITASSRLIPLSIRGSGPSCPNPCRMAVESLMNPLSVSCVCGHSDTTNSQSRDDGSSTN